MTLQSSGNPISYSDIIKEFGQAPSFGSYRIAQEIGELTCPLDNGIPGPGNPIKFSDFYDKKLNLVVDCYSGTTEYRVNVRRQKWGDDQNRYVTVVGGFTGKPVNTSGKKVIIHVNKYIGSVNGNAADNAYETTSGKNEREDLSALKVALTTGKWDFDTEMRIDVGNEGAIYGGGGNGGQGASSRSDESPRPGLNGGNGTSALGIEYSPISIGIQPGGRIIRGYGGGGGGSGDRDVDPGADRCAVGGGGGGGAGLPGGAGGARGDRLSGKEDEVAQGGATAGTAGQRPQGGEQGGPGGSGANNDNEAYGGSGGKGGDETQNAGNGVSVEDHVAGKGGGNGAAIRSAGGGYIINIENPTRVIGPTNALGVD